MKLSKPWKIFIGIMTVLQLFVGLFYLIWFFSVVFPVVLSGNEAAIEAIFLESLGGFLVSIIFLVIMSFAVFIFYVIHAASNPHIGGGMKALWIILIFFFGSMAEVVYFFMEVVPERSMTARIEEA